MHHSAVRTASGPRRAPAMRRRRSPWIPTGLASDILGVSDKTVVQMAVRHKLTVRRTDGGHRRFRIDEIQALAEGGAEGLAQLANAA